MKLLLAAGGLLAAVYVVAAWSDRRAHLRRSGSAAAELIGDRHASGSTVYTPIPRRIVVLIVAAAIGGLLASAYGQSSHLDAAQSNRADRASNNFARCQATVAAGWRKGIAVLLIGYPTDNTPPDKLPADLVAVARQLDLPRSLDGIRAEGRQRIIAALLDDDRLDAVTHRICPFVAGDPDRTPRHPVQSATTALEAELRAARGEPSTTTTPSTSPGD